MLGGLGYVWSYGVVTVVQQLSTYVAVPVTVWVFVPLLHGLKLTSAYGKIVQFLDLRAVRLANPQTLTISEYLELRFGLRARLVGSSLFVLRIFLYLGQALYAPSLALEAVAGIPIWATVLCAGVVSAAYTIHGGMRTVIWTDIMQFGVLWGGMLLLTAVAWSRIDGDILAIAEDADRLTFADPGSSGNYIDWTSPYAFWNIVIGGIPLALVQMATDQIAVQRYDSLYS